MLKEQTNFRSSVALLIQQKTKIKIKWNFDAAAWS